MLMRQIEVRMEDIAENRRRSVIKFGAPKHTKITKKAIRKGNTVVEETFHSFENREITKGISEGQFFLPVPTDIVWLRTFHQMASSSSKDDDEKKRPAQPKGEASSPQKLPWKRKREVPKRPLSAYNIFFQDERQRLLEEMNVSQHYMFSMHSSSSSADDSNQPPQTGFADLARDIASKWDALGNDAKGLYQALAEKEQIRYAREMAYYNLQEAQERLDAKGGLRDTGDIPQPQLQHQQQQPPLSQHHQMPGFWHDTAMGSGSSLASGLEGVNLPNSQAEPTPSMRTRSPLRYALDSLPLFASAPGENPEVESHWSKHKQSKPNALPFLMTAAAQPQQLQQPQQQLQQPQQQLQQPQQQLQQPRAHLQQAHPESAYLSPTSAERESVPLLDLMTRRLSPSLQQLSNDLDEEEQDFLISSLGGDYQEESSSKTSDESRPRKRARR